LYVAAVPHEAAAVLEDRLGEVLVAGGAVALAAPVDVDAADGDAELVGDLAGVE
jgi:hypothetical protein